MSELTEQLVSAHKGARVAAADLLPLVYDELRKLAASKLAREQPGLTLDATALVHEAFIKLGGDLSFESKSDYFKAAAVAMRRILVDSARARKAVKRGGGMRVELDIEGLPATIADHRIEDLDEALSLLALQNPAMAKLVELRFFGGLTLARCAETLQISERTADAWWAYARAWLSVEIEKMEKI